MNNSFDKIKSTVFSIGVVLLVLIVPIVGLGGGIWLANHITPFVVSLSAYCLFISMILIFPLSLFRVCRKFTIPALIFISYIYGISLWLSTMSFTFNVWGIWGVVVGLVILGFGIVPIGMIAAITSGSWSILALFIFLIICTFATRFIGYLFASFDEDVIEIGKKRKIALPLLLSSVGYLTIIAGYFFCVFLLVKDISKDNVDPIIFSWGSKPELVEKTVPDIEKQDPPYNYSLDIGKFKSPIFRKYQLSDVDCTVHYLFDTNNRLRAIITSTELEDNPSNCITAFNNWKDTIEEIAGTNSKPLNNMRSQSIEWNYKDSVIRLNLMTNTPMCGTTIISYMKK